VGNLINSANALFVRVSRLQPDTQDLSLFISYCSEPRGNLHSNFFSVVCRLCGVSLAWELGKPKPPKILRKLRFALLFISVSI